MNKNKVKQRQRAIKPINPLFQNSLSRRRENPRGQVLMDASLLQTTTIEHMKRSTTPLLEDNILESTFDMENTITGTGYGRGRRKVIRDRTTTTPKENNLRFHNKNMAPEQLGEVVSGQQLEKTRF